jgi:hypothetical protein
MSQVQGQPPEKLLWLQEHKAAGRLDGDDPDEVAEAEALLAMLAGISGSAGRRHRRHLDDLLDEGLRQTFPASDPVSVGHFTGIEAPSQPIERAVADVTGVRKTRTKRFSRQRQLHGRQ